MKNFKLTNLAIAVSLSLTGCFSSSSSDNEGDAESYVAPSVVEAVEMPIIIQVVDQNGELISAMVKLLGDDAKYIVDVESGQSTSSNEYTVEGGELLLSAVNVPDGLTSLSFDIVATADGYFSNSSEVSVSVGEDALATITLSTKTITDTSIAVKSTSKEFSVDESTGATAEEIHFATDSAKQGDENAVGLAGGSASVKIPTGTIMEDSAGELVTGTLTANLNYYSNEPNGTGDSELSSLSAFPGGFNIGSLVDSTTGEETEESFNFVTAGFVAMEISNEDGDTVKSFSEPVDISIQLSADTINPDTGVAIKPGDTIPTWSYEETTGKWSAESEVTVNDDLDPETNTYTATMNVDHLSYWNLDWHYSSCAANPLTINFENASGEPNNSAFQIGLKRSGYYNTVFGDDTTMTIANSPTFSDLNISVTAVNGESILSKIDGVAVGESGIYTGSFCDLDGSTITLDTTEQKVVTGLFSTNSVCEDDNSIVTQQPGYMSMYAIIGNRYIYQGYHHTYTDQPTVINDLYSGIEYYISYYINGRYQRTTITVEADETQSFALNFPVYCETSSNLVATGSGGTTN